MWTKQEHQVLTEIITDKKLYARIEGINEDNKILYIDIFAKDSCASVHMANSVTLQLLKANMVSPATVKPKTHRKLTKYVPVMKFPHLYPTIEAIEEGKVPSSLWEQNLVKDNVPLDLLLRPYYKYEDINAQI